MLVKDILSKTLDDTYIIVNFIEHDKNIWIPPEYMDDICNSFVGDLHVDNITTDTRVIFQDDMGGMVPDRAIISYLVINAYRGKDLVPISKDKLEKDLKNLSDYLAQKKLGS